MFVKERNQQQFHPPPAKAKRLSWRHALCFRNQYFYQGLNIMFSGAALEGHQLYYKPEQYSWCAAPNEPIHTIRRDLWRNKGKPRIRTVPKKGHKQGNFGDCPDKLRF